MTVIDSECQKNEKTFKKVDSLSIKTFVFCVNTIFKRFGKNQIITMAFKIEINVLWNVLPMIFSMCNLTLYIRRVYEYLKFFKRGN